MRYDFSKCYKVSSIQGIAATFSIL